MARIDELKKLIHEASVAYGNAEPIMSDKEFDQLVNELKSLDPSYIDTVTYDDHVDGFPKAKHNLVTGTLAKCKNEEEFADWIKKHPGYYMMEQKIDGAGMELQFENGLLVQAVTRGNGFEGDVVTDNVSKIPDVVTNLKNNFTGSIRGEVYMKRSVFNKLYKNKMKNCRNAAAGIMKHKDGSECENLAFIAYDIQEAGTITIFTEDKKLTFLKSCGFEIPAYKLINSYEGAIAFREAEYKGRDGIEYDIDGVVVKPETIDYEDLKNRTPKNSCAIKFELDVAVSEVIDIVWNQSGKYFNPIAIIKPVELCGVTVQRASCSNVNQLLKMGVEIGCKVAITRRGEIIPHIEYVVTN